MRIAKCPAGVDHNTSPRFTARSKRYSAVAEPANSFPAPKSRDIDLISCELSATGATLVFCGCYISTRRSKKARS
jgi:hypothetical protein